MGNCAKVGSGTESPNDFILQISSFQRLYAIGRGGFGKVWRIQSKREKEQYAMKEMSKARIVLKKSVEAVFREL